MDLYSEREHYRAVIELRTPEGETATIIVTRRRGDHAGQVWLTFHGALKTTLVMNDQEASQVIDAIDTARRPQ